eukprot:CAMPEP_0113321046 /NCGR_PEP_ID=MMETSP0010_2-20120614/14660_1 /TAXON_ID=216773 ORGANISM="Corethron hystrix, Strain 308" /NCGR_SAMPLE_ID=MMETSP0010_2 /ASSEMBLY_ACC=CAM_ASM_000155 /LENGTH=101 /DNA_ID=CAMNT_0000179047 /DNA_START=54 /DNA_END=356 /DNA_ORIENTATION=- /assembly_acc=CAM_ASM_000155
MSYTTVPGLATTYLIKTPGSGTATIISGTTATLHATGIVRETGKKFWSTKDPGQEPFTCQYGVGQLIKGWDMGCIGMKVGEVREVLIPAAEGYGSKGFPAW